MSLFETLLSKFKEEQEKDKADKSVPNVTCTHEENTVHKDSKHFCLLSTSPAQVTDGTKLSTDPKPGECEKCPACGYWDKPMSGPGKYCFYEAYFLGKSVKAQLADKRQEECPLDEALQTD
jgi:hypothetical protein